MIIKNFTIAFSLFAIFFYSLSSYAHDNCKYNINSPLSEPVYSDNFIRNWAAYAVTDTMTFNFSDYKERLQNSSAYFTETGKKSFTKAIDNSGFLENVKENRTVLTSVISGAPVIISYGTKSIANGLGKYFEKETSNENSDVYFWIIEVPTVISYEIGNRRRSDNIITRLEIHRSSDANNSDGIGIYQWRAF